MTADEAEKVRCCPLPVCGAPMMWWDLVWAVPFSAGPPPTRVRLWPCLHTLPLAEWHVVEEVVRVATAARPGTEMDRYLIRAVDAPRHSMEGRSGYVVR